LLGKQIEAPFDYSYWGVLAGPKHNQVVACANCVSIATLVLTAIVNAGRVGPRVQVNTEGIFIENLETSTNDYLARRYLGGAS
jgi:hypothetical protein